jgi:CBS domain-containing protein
MQECMALMTDKRIRHLPVVRDNAVIGIISIGDVVRAIIEEQQVLISHLENYIVGQ